MSVSRETKREQPEEKQIEKPAKPAKKKKEPEPVLAYEDEYIIALLAGANKHHKQQDLEKFSQLPAYLNELEWVKYANALKHAVIVGSGVNYLVLAVDSPLEAREINELERDEELERFIHELLGSRFQIGDLAVAEARDRPRIACAFDVRAVDRAEVLAALGEHPHA